MLYTLYTVAAGSLREKAGQKALPKVATLSSDELCPGCQACRVTLLYTRRLCWCAKEAWHSTAYCMVFT